MCDTQTEFEALLHKTFDAVMGEYPSLRDRVAAPLFLRSHDALALQAADLLAHETHKEIRNRSKTPPRRPSKALERLLQGRMHLATYQDRSVVEALHEQERANLSLPPEARAEIFTLPAVYEPRGVVRTSEE